MSIHKRQLIVSILRNHYEQAATAYRHAHAEHMGMIAAANAWDEANKEDGVGGFSRNPYNISIAANKEEQCRISAANLQGAYEFAVDTFLAEVEQKEQPK